MEAITAEQIEQSPEPAAQVPASKMFKYSDFLDVGEGAVECEHARDGQCTDIEHFHGWLRLPNPFQHEDIRKKGTAAKARRIRELNDPDSDASLVLDASLGDSEDSVFRAAIIDELLAREWAQDYLDAQQDVNERDEFEHIDQDREEYARLALEQAELAEDEQSGEFKALAKHVSDYVEAMRVRLLEIQAPKRADLEARPFESVLTLVRSQRVEEEGDRQFVDTYNAWMWFVGTFQVEPHKTLGRPYKPMWESIGTKDRPQLGTMFGEAPEVIEALKVAFNDLQIALQRASAGN